jgi:hypothetical protein
MRKKALQRINVFTFKLIYKRTRKLTVIGKKMSLRYTHIELSKLRRFASAKRMLSAAFFAKCTLHLLVF